MTDSPSTSFDEIDRIINELPAPGIKRDLSRWKILLEWVVIFLAVWAFCAIFLDLGSTNHLPGNEAGIFQVLDQVLVNALQKDHRFPLWNPWLRTGLPYVADPMLHIYNPLVSIPVLLWGVLNGFKIALFLSFLAGAWGMWVLGKALGMGRFSRVWIALMYAFAGQPAARFFQGQYLFVLGAAWIPWIIACLVYAMKAPRRRFVALAALAIALLFLSGNVYYSFYLLFVMGFFALAMTVSLRRQKPFVSLDRSRIMVLLTAGLLSLALVAVQLFPLMQFWSRLGKSMDLAGSHTLVQIWRDYTSRDPARPDAIQVLPAREEFYAYIGIWPFLGCLLLPFTYRKGNGRLIIFLLMICAWVVLWIGVAYLPWREWFLDSRTLLQFRHLLRALILGSFALIVLGGLGLDYAWKYLDKLVQLNPAGIGDALRSSLGRAGIFFLGAFMLASVLDLFTTNRQHMRTYPINPALNQAAVWLRQYDPSDVYVRFNPNNTGHEELVSNNLRFIDAWYHFADIQIYANNPDQRLVRAFPNYILQAAGQPAPEYPDPLLVQQVDGFDIYWLPHSLPLVFSVNKSALSVNDNSGELRREQVTQQSWVTTGPNTLEVIASGGTDERLVVLMTDYPGWKVKVDGKPHPLHSLGGYLAVDLLAGVHKYEFAFRPASFYWGLLISLAGMAIMIYLLASGIQVSVASFGKMLRGLPAKVKQLWNRVFQPQPGSRKANQRWVTDAVYRQGAIHPEQPLDIAEDEGVHVVIDTGTQANSSTKVAVRRWVWASLDLFSALQTRFSLESWLFTACLVIYLFTRLFHLTDFPIYFMADEAAQSLYAQQLIDQGFRDRLGIMFPVYVEAAGSRWTPLVSMYVQAVTLTLFGKSIFVTRATSALVSVLAFVSVGLILKNVFKVRYWWLGSMLLTLTPTWLLHSRTAFETVMTTAFYGCFLYFYMLYRTRSPRFIYPALVFGALTFYTYSNAQVIMVSAAALLFISDLPYHLRQWRTLLGGAVVGLVLALPFLIFRFNQPEALGTHLRAVNSYWFTPISLTEKLSIYTQKLAYGLSPQYWFLPNGQDLVRHRFPTMGHIRLEELPLILVGIVLCLRYFRSSPHRALLIAAVVTPAGAALLDIGIPRVLAFVVPASVLGGLGLDWLLKGLQGRIRYGLTVGATFLIFLFASLAMLRMVLVESSLWFSDYGLYGMQYGAKQLFQDTLPQYLVQNPGKQLLISPNWANATDRFLDFFLTPEQRARIRMDSIEGYLFKRLPLQGNEVFVMSATEYEKAVTSPKFKDVVEDKLLYYPDGSPGFIFVHLAYSDQADQIFAAEKEARRQLLSGQVELNGQLVELRYSQIDIGEPRLMFDHDHFSLMRGLEANPFILEMYFPQLQTFSGLEADFGVADLTLTVMLYEDPRGEPTTYSASLTNADIDPVMKIKFDQGPSSVTKIRFEILNRATGEIANIHIKELNLLP